MGTEQDDGVRAEAHTVEWHFEDAQSASSVQARYRAELAHFQARKRIAFIVRIVTTVLAVALLALGVALVASSFTTMANEYLAVRHVPGSDGSITIKTSGPYALTHTDGGQLPACGIVDADGEPVPVEAWIVDGNPPLETWRFEAAPGQYTVTCEGGNEGLVAYAADSVEMLQRGYLGIALQAIPFILVGLALYWGGKVAAARIAPESLRPLIPS